MMPKKTGKPRALELEAIKSAEQQVLSESIAPFVRELFGESVTAEMLSSDVATGVPSSGTHETRVETQLLDKDGVPLPPLPSLTWLRENFRTKSAVIRYLVSEGFEIKRISKHLNLRYQHVRNVAKSVLKRGPNEDWRRDNREGE